MEGDIESKITFLPVKGGKRLPFRSRLEARWAVFFTHCGLKWSYEPKTFQLPSGLTYTPDFFVERVGWFEIKPSDDKLHEGRKPILEFCKTAPAILRAESEKHFFIAVAHRPLYEAILIGYAPEKQVPLLSRFWQASSHQSIPSAAYCYVIHEAEEMATKWRQMEITLAEFLFQFRSKELGTSFRKLASDYKGEQAFPMTANEVVKVRAPKRARLSAQDRKKNLS